MHECSEAEFLELLVSPFPPESTRHGIAEGFLNLRREAVTVGISGTHWIDGSYVTAKSDPGDVDVVTFVPLDLLNTLDEDGRVLAMKMASGRAAKASYKTDSYLVAVTDEGHPQHHAYEQMRTYWRKWFGHTRPVEGAAGETVPGHVKGLLALGLGVAELQPSVPAWEGGPA